MGAREPASILTHLFSISCDRDIFSSNWKTARVQPVPKEGSKTIPSNSRPISLLVVVSKTMEKYVNTKFLKYLEKHRI